MNITIKGNGCKVKLDKEASTLLIDALYQYQKDRLDTNADDNEISRQLGLIQWIGTIFND